MEKIVNILLVEDDLISQKLAKILLNKKGWMVTTASDGLAAVKAAESVVFDIILMDVKLPIMDGFEATKIIKEHYNFNSKSVPVVAVTACAMKGDKETCLKQGMDDYLSKPFTSEALYAVVLKHLNHKQIYLPKILSETKVANLYYVLFLSCWLLLDG